MSPQDEREAIARIIDPDAFYRKDQTLAGLNPGWAVENVQACCTRALTKADAILALRQPGAEYRRGVEADDATLDRVYEAIVRAGCPNREGPYGGYDYGYNEDFYGPAPKQGRYVVRDFRVVGSDTFGAPVHYSHDREQHEEAFRRLTGRHIAAAAIRALPESTKGEGR